MSVFDSAVDFVLRWEGGYVNDSRDPGGETNWGISKRAHPRVDIASLTMSQAIEIYRTEYWNAIRGDELPPWAALVVFDGAVNHGVFTSSRCLQSALGARVDGVVGKDTIKAAHAADPVLGAQRTCSERMVKYASLTHWDVYCRNWSRRVLDCYATAITLV